MKKRTKVSDYSLPKMLKRVRQLEQEGWTPITKYKQELTTGERIKYVIMMEHQKHNHTAEKTDEEVRDDFKRNQQLANYLKEQRESVGVSKKKIAELVGVGETTYRHYELGRFYPRMYEYFIKKFNSEITKLKRTSN